ncbi:hypothetical protein SESBI_32642 [Sesbania bispinosa]|nr:hypothetical protein SESBI_32642 [Sesbania bispinosa]
MLVDVSKENGPSYAKAQEARMETCGAADSCVNDVMGLIPAGLSKDPCMGGPQVNKQSGQQATRQGVDKVLNMQLDDPCIGGPQVMKQSGPLVTCQGEALMTIESGPRAMDGPLVTCQDEDNALNLQLDGEAPMTNESGPCAMDEGLMNEVLCEKETDLGPCIELANNFPKVGPSTNQHANLEKDNRMGLDPMGGRDDLNTHGGVQEGIFLALGTDSSVRESDVLDGVMKEVTGGALHTQEVGSLSLLNIGELNGEKEVPVDPEQGSTLCEVPVAEANDLEFLRLTTQEPQPKKRRGRPKKKSRCLG